MTKRKKIGQKCICRGLEAKYNRKMVQFILSENYLSMGLYLHLQGKRLIHHVDGLLSSPRDSGVQVVGGPLLSASGQTLNSLRRHPPQREEVWDNVKPTNFHNPSSKIWVIKVFLSTWLTRETHAFSRHPGLHTQHHWEPTVAFKLREDQ